MHAFEGRQRTNNVRVTPGEIKSSVLTHTKTMTVNSFLRALFNAMKARALTTGNVRMNLGNYRFMMLEKQMDTAAADEPSIQLGYELNNTLGGRIICKPAYCDTIQERI